MARRHRSWPWKAALLHLAPLVRAEDFQELRRLVVLADTHGDFDAMQRSLKLAEIPAPPKYPTTLVSLGDLVDRGPDSPECYEELHRLAMANETFVHGVSKVIRIFGNHDWLNLLGVAERDDRTTPHRENLLAPFVHVEELRKFDGWPGRIKEFGPDGRIGRQLRQDFRLIAQTPEPPPGGCQDGLLPLSAASTLFLHAGIWAKTATQYKTAEDLANAAAEDVAEGRAFDSDLFHELTQDRSMAQGRQGTCEELSAVLGHFCAARLVLGHTPTPLLGREGHRAATRCGGRLVLLDVGMSRWLKSMTDPDPDGHPAILEMIHNGETVSSLKVLYEGGKEDDLPIDQGQPQNNSEL